MNLSLKKFATLNKIACLYAFIPVVFFVPAACIENIPMYLYKTNTSVSSSKEREKEKRTDAFFSSWNPPNPPPSSPAPEGNVNFGKELSMLLTDKASSPPSPTLFSLAPLQQPALRAFVDAPVSRAQVVTSAASPNSLWAV